MTLYTSIQFAQRADLSRQYIERLEREGKLPRDAETVSGRPLWREDTVERFIAKRRQNVANGGD